MKNEQEESDAVTNRMGKAISSSFGREGRLIMEGRQIADTFAGGASLRLGMLRLRLNC